MRTLHHGEHLSFAVSPPLLCPYFNRWGEPATLRSGKFRDLPLRAHASSTSGSPVVEGPDGKFFGLLSFSWQEADKVSFEFDGERSLVVRNEGTTPVEIYCGAEEREPGEHWRDYNLVLSRRLPPSRRQWPFWSDIEYCTWVEQKRQAALAGRREPFSVFDAAFLDRYIRRIEALGLPAGKLTIDHGWQLGNETYGDWRSHPGRFPRIEAAAARIAEAGFTPGIWLAPVWLHPQSEIARANPALLGEPIMPSNADAPINGDRWNYWVPCDAFEERMREVFGGLYAMGFRKFKFDMVYARLDLMVALQERAWRAATEVAPDAEIECHHPNPFFAQFCDSVRTNDVLCNGSYRWRELTREHFLVCERSAFGKLINLDHIGGNDPMVTPEDFLEHLGMYEDATGYPTVSLLPEHLGEEVVERLREYLIRYDIDRNARSLFVGGKEWTNPEDESLVASTTYPTKA